MKFEIQFRISTLVVLMLSALFLEVLSNNNRWTLNGKNVVVTGGTKGIGKSVVEECCDMSGRVFTCSRNEKELNECLQAWNEKGYDVGGVVADVSKHEDREKLVSCALKFFNNKIHVLVNNAGINIRKPMVDYTSEEYYKIMQTNLESAFFLSQSFHPYLKQTVQKSDQESDRIPGSGSVINIGSIAGGGHISLKSGVVYAMTKAAMAQMTYNLACEWASDNVRVNTVAPAYIYTPLTDKLLSDPVFLQTIVHKTPLKRVGTVEEVSAAVVFLAMDVASYITGQVLFVDGGFIRNGNFD
mmetsp:Transcript_9482/g.9541  ORF Transcript_9482/g.9541 Transcript_9482/m.9541 type:complete len:299 (-) Transcript_9482:83-979(-)